MAGITGGRLAAAADAERRELERELHDGVQQDLVSICVRLQLARGLVESDPPALRALLGELERDAFQALARVRDLTESVYPSMLAARGLADALHSLARVDADSVGRYPEEVEAGVYFLCRDALAAAAPGARVSLREQDGALRIEISNAGDAPGEVRDRVAALGGRLAEERGSLVAIVPVYSPDSAR